MAELKESSSEDSFTEADEQKLYSFKDCQQIGKGLLDELKQSLKVTISEIEEPRAKAVKYLEKTEVLQLLEVSLCMYHNFSLQD